MVPGGRLDYANHHHTRRGVHRWQQQALVGADVRHIRVDPCAVAQPTVGSGPSGVPSHIERGGSAENHVRCIVEGHQEEPAQSGNGANAPPSTKNNENRWD
jgi:hypothetical protein